MFLLFIYCPPRALPLLVLYSSLCVTIPPPPCLCFFLFTLSRKKFCSWFIRFHHYCGLFSVFVYRFLQIDLASWPRMLREKVIGRACCSLVFFLFFLLLVHGIRSAFLISSLSVNTLPPVLPCICLLFAFLLLSCF